MTDTTNVIQFPRQSSKVPTLDEVSKNINLAAEDEVLDITDIICQAVVETLEQAGFPALEDAESVKDLCFALEGIRALLYKYYKLEHPFHEFAEHSFLEKEGKYIFVHPQFKFKTKNEDFEEQLEEALKKIQEDELEE